MKCAVQEEREPAGVRPEEGHRDDQKMEAPLPQRQAERVGAVTPIEGYRETSLRPTGKMAGALYQTEL